jgi:hypothetical protein
MRGMMLLRYALMAATLFFICALFYAAAQPRAPREGWWFFFMVQTALALNFFYLLRCPPINMSPSRVRKLIELWLDAKEQELRERAKRKTGDAE